MQKDARINLLARVARTASLEDALLNIAGISPSVGDGQRDQVYIRGFSAQYDQYLDGVRDEQDDRAKIAAADA